MASVPQFPDLRGGNARISGGPQIMGSASKRAGCHEDDQLMGRIADGDELAAKKLVTDYLPLQMSLARRLLGNEAEAEEVAQDAFLKLWKQAPDWQPERALISTWLGRVTSNLCIDRLRARRTRPLESYDVQPVAAGQQVSMEEKALQQRVNNALDHLPERQKLALTLCHYEGMSQKQAAQIMEISEHALESLLARARRGLKKTLESEWKQLLPDRGEIETYSNTDIPGRAKK